MIHLLFSRWLHQPLWLRLICYFSSVGLCGLMMWLFWAQSVHQHAATLILQEQAARESYRNIKLALSAEDSVAVAKATVTDLQKTLLAVVIPPFSLAALLEQVGSELVSWLPEKQGGVLTLRLSWQKIITLLGDVSAFPATMMFSHFTLAREGEQLMLQARLAFNHEV